MKAVLEHVTTAFDNVKKRMNPSLANELATSSLKNLRLMTPDIAQDISQCPIYQALEQASSPEKSINFPDWFFLAIPFPADEVFYPAEISDGHQESLFYGPNKRRRNRKPPGLSGAAINLENERADIQAPEVTRSHTPNGAPRNREQMMADAEILPDIINSSRDSIDDIGDEFSDLQCRIAALEIWKSDQDTWKKDQELAMAEANRQVKESNMLVKECHDIMKSQAEQIAALSKEKTSREEFSLHKADVNENVSAEFVARKKSFDNEIGKLSSSFGVLKAEFEGLRPGLFDSEEKTKVQQTMDKIEKEMVEQKQRLVKFTGLHDILSKAHDTLSNAHHDLFASWISFSDKTALRFRRGKSANKRKDATDHEVQGGGKRQCTAGDRQHKAEDRRSPTPSSM
ncbi:hypothetical protein ACHAP5_009338 [Fusarium lateritium]